ncbi:MAG: nickel pincer cofactor biosynthesis protein LarC [Desulfatitalea sp.]
MTLAYFDCFSGISGDMTLGALVHLGVPAAWLKETLRSLPLDGFDIQVRCVQRNGIAAMKVDVESAEEHHHRHFGHIQALIEKCPLSDRVKRDSMAIFERIADAEAKIHCCPKESVHFHEVGSMDAIVDVVGSCLAMEYLGIDTILASALPLGRGFVTCAHGVIPVPAPAVLEILKGVPVYSGNAEMELVTPTGAAILVGTGAEFASMPPMKILRVGYGAGTREIDGRPNLLRVLLGEATPSHSATTPERLVMVETSIDDMNPEIFGYLMETLFDDGALDVFWVPVQMKKNRPGTLVKVLCAPEHREQVVARILAETTSLGVRYHEVYRTALPRQTVTVQSAFGTIEVKRVVGLDGDAQWIPEYEVCRRIAQERKVPLRQVYETIRRTARPLD